LLANIRRAVSQTLIGVSIIAMYCVNSGFQSQRARSRKIRVPRSGREASRLFAIHEKNRALVEPRSLLLEPSLQRVYHVVFVNTLRNPEPRRRAQAAVANGVRIKVAAEALDLLVGLLKVVHQTRTADG
jgi:hypothetical protein